MLTCPKTKGFVFSFNFISLNVFSANEINSVNTDLVTETTEIVKIPNESISEVH